MRTVIGFDVIYLLRIALGFTMIPWMYSGSAFGGSPFVNLEFSIATCTILDLTPLVFVMILHRRNFKRQATIRCSFYVGFSKSLASCSEEFLRNDEFERGESLVTLAEKREVSGFDLLKKEEKFGVQTLESY